MQIVPNKWKFSILSCKQVYIKIVVQKGRRPNVDHCWRWGEEVQEPLILADVICEQPLKRKRPTTIQNYHISGKWYFWMVFGRNLLTGDSDWPYSFSIGFLLFSQFWILDAQCRSHRALVLKWHSQFGEIPGGSNCGFVRLLACSLDNIRRWWEDYNCDIGGFSSQPHL